MEQPELKEEPIWNAGVADSGLTHYTTMLALELILKCYFLIYLYRICQSSRSTLRLKSWIRHMMKESLHT